MKWDLSDVGEVPALHTWWFEVAVLPLMATATGVPALVQDVAVRMWVLGPGTEPHTAQERWQEELKVVHQHTKPRTQKRERMYDDLGWDYAWQEAERYGTLVEDGGLEGWYLGDMLLDAAPAQRGFLFHWAVEGLAVEEAAKQSGVSRATGYRWRDELMYTLQQKWGVTDGGLGE